MPRPRPNLCTDFIDYLRERNAAPVNLRNARDWIHGAIVTSMGAGNPAGSTIRLSQNATEDIGRVIESFFVSLANEIVPGQTGFDQIFFGAVENIERSANVGTDGNLFTFGRSQKIVTIALKYCYAWWFGGNAESPRFGNLEWVERWAPFFHIPIDNITLRHLRQGEQFRHLAVSGTYTLSWKWHLSKSRYCRIQDAIRLLAGERVQANAHAHVHAYEDAVHYEMDRIWTRAEQPADEAEDG